MIVVVLKVQDLLKNYMGGLKNSIPAEWVHELYHNYLTEYHRQEARMCLRKMSQHNRGNICYICARKALRTQCADNCTHKGVQKRIQREHQNHCHPQVTTGSLHNRSLWSANLYCVPGTWAAPRPARVQKPKEWPYNRKIRCSHLSFPPYLYFPK